MRQFSAFISLLSLGTFLLAGCGGSYNSPSPGPVPGAQTAQMSVSITDAPPTGVTVLSFEVTVTGATLNPGNVDLLGSKGPMKIEVKKLETQTAFLSTASIAAGNYTSLNLTFSNPELTFRNDSGGILGGCASGNVCEINPSGPLAATINGTFYPTAGSQSGVLVDLSLANLITPALGVDFSTSSAVTVTGQAKNGQGQLDDIDGLSGIVATPSSSQFVLQTMNMGAVTVSIDANTQFAGFDTCTTAGAACLQSGQSIDADLALLAGGTLLARRVELQDDVQAAAADELEGIISKVDSPAQFEMVVTDELRSFANVSVGNPITVLLTTTGSGTSFRVDSHGLSVPSTLQQSFENQTDTSSLMPGQTVQVRKSNLAGGPAPAAITLTTDRVRLRTTSLTATVTGASASTNFNLGNLPALFAANGVNLVQVQTSSQTSFENVGGVTGLADGTMVSVRGLLFSSSPNPVIVADKIRKR